MKYMNLGSPHHDWIDVYFAHRFDLLVPIAESLHVFDILVQQGKVALYMSRR